MHPSTFLLPTAPPQLAMEKPRRQRTGRPKTRTGCLTCKRRRVKCDERKPFCRRCETFEVACDGYRTDEKRTTAGPVAGTSQKAVTKKTSSKLYILDIGSNPRQHLFADELQYRYFRLFCDYTVRSLSGFFDKSLWGELVLQACETDPAIRHAVVAIGALDKTLESLPQPRNDKTSLAQYNMALWGEEHYKFAVQHYAAALRIMRDSISEKRHDIRTTLIACLLAVCFELFHGNMQSALCQAQSGLKLINEWLKEAKGPVKSIVGLDSPIPSVVDDELIQAFARLDIHAISFKSSRGVEMNTLASKDIQEICRGMPSSFSSLREARAYWEILLRQTLHWTVVAYFWGSELKDHQEAAKGTSGKAVADGTEWISTSSLEDRRNILDQQDRYLRSLELWWAAFSPLLADARTSLDPMHMAGATALYLRFRSAHIALHSSMFKEETQFDAHRHIFAEIIAMATSALKILDRGDSTRKVTFTFDSGFIGPLYVVAVLCRDISLRRQAIAALEAFPRREGVWDSVLAAKAATIIMNIEERGLEAGRIPEHARIRGVKLTSDLQKRVAELQYFVPKRGEDGAFLIRSAKFSW